MNRSIISELYHAGRDSKLFVNLVPKGEGGSWLKIYGSVQHNLPHGFYFGAIGHNLVLACEVSRTRPIWYAYDYLNRADIQRTPDLYTVISNWNDESWPYLDDRLAQFHPKLLKVEEVLDKGPKEISDFIIFNIHLF
jgi:hypothetical protein